MVSDTGCNREMCRLARKNCCSGTQHLMAKLSIFPYCIITHKIKQNVFGTMTSMQNVNATHLLIKEKHTEVIRRHYSEAVSHAHNNPTNFTSRCH